MLATPQNKAPLDWSRDGKFLLYRSPTLVTGFDLWALPMQGDQKAFSRCADKLCGKGRTVFPDSNWVAYESNESGRFEIYVQRFPDSGGRLQVSANGGAQVRWRSDGKELFYIGFDGMLMAVPIQISGTSIEAGSAIPLFPTHIGGPVQGTDRQQYSVSRDGQRFLLNTVVAEADTSALTVISNWKPKP